MSSSELRAKIVSRRLLIGLAVAAIALPGCTVRPLYSSAPLATSGLPAAADLSSIAIKPPVTRYGQEVRNHLIFLLSGGKGEPAEPLYSLALTVSAVEESAASIQVATENQPTAATMTMIGSFTLTNMEGEVIGKGSQRIMSSYDLPQQEFAALRAKRDAENRAARELAELLRLVIAQELAKTWSPESAKAGAKAG
jgi:LPS-assembly lipoprotein